MPQQRKASLSLRLVKGTFSKSRPAAMSLYGDLESGSSGGRKEETAASKLSSSHLKLLQSQIALKKASLTSQRERDSLRPPPRTPSGVAAVVDLRAASGSVIAPSGGPKTSLLKPRAPVLAFSDGPPLSFIPSAAKDEAVLIFGEVTVENEYDPMIPNDYNEMLGQWELERAKEKALERAAAAKERAEKRTRREEEREEKEEDRKRVAGAAIAPPSTLAAGPPSQSSGPAPDLAALGSALAPKGMGFAERLMSKMGYKKGEGLGKSRQGMATALSVEKTSGRGGRIIDHTKEEPREPSPEGTEESEPVGPGLAATALPPGSQPPPPDPVPITELLKSPTKVVLLKNMVGAEEGGDPDLQQEVKEEMAKYGQVAQVLVFQMPPPALDYDAVRIFVEFGSLDQAIKAVVDLNGRFFGGRQIRAAFYDPARLAKFDLRG